MKDNEELTSLLTSKKSADEAEKDEAVVEENESLKKSLISGSKTDDAVANNDDTDAVVKDNEELKNSLKPKGTDDADLEPRIPVHVVIKKLMLIL